MITNFLNTTFGSIGWGPRWNEGAALQFDDIVAIIWVLFFLVTLLGLLYVAIRAWSAKSHCTSSPAAVATAAHEGGEKVPLRVLSAGDQNWILAGRMREQRLNHVRR